MANGKNGSLDDPNVTIDQVGGADPTNPESPTGMYLIVRYNGVELPNGRYTPSDIKKLKEARWSDYKKVPQTTTKVNKPAVQQSTTSGSSIGRRR